MNTTTISQSHCWAPIAGCLISAEKETGSAGHWKSVYNDSQTNTKFLAYYAKERQQIINLPELESIASTSAEAINEFLSSHGFNIKIKPFNQNPPGIAVASVFKLLLEWTKPGRVTTLLGGDFSAVRIAKDLDFFTSTKTKEPIVSIKAKNDDRVFMTVVDPLLTSELMELVQKISVSMKVDRKFDGVIFPMISYDQEVDIRWVNGMETIGKDGPWRISQAVQQTKFRMNEIGAKVESAVAMGIKFSYCADKMPDLIIDKPFLLWISRNGITHPLFIAHFTEEVWKRPNRL